MNAICCSLNLDFFIDGFPRPAPAKPNREFPTKNGPIRRAQVIARALLKDAPILLLDEATSALDVATEARLQESLDRLRQGRTTFIIAHRLSTIRSADRIVVLDQGRMVETGGFDELIARGGTFAMLARDAGLTAAANDLDVKALAA